MQAVNALAIVLIGRDVPRALAVEVGGSVSIPQTRPHRKQKLAILVNMVAPYRVPIYCSLARDFDTLVLHGGIEGNRSWSPEAPASLRTHKVWTLQIRGKKRNGVAGVTERKYIHLNLGLPWSLARFRPDIVVSIEMGVRSLIAVLYGKLARIPVWVWWGGTLHSERNISTSRRILRAFVVRHVRRWISYGATSTAYLRSIGVPREQILQIQNCVPQETFTQAPIDPKEMFENQPHPVIISVGQLVQRKGMDKLIEACGRLAGRGRAFSLVIVGQGPDRDDLVELAKENHIEHFRILPNQPQQTLNELYRAADVFVFPTLDDPWGLVVNEAMWAGVPVLCSKYAGCAEELVQESQIFDPQSPESFDAALAMVFDRSVCPPDRSRLKTWQEVADMIRQSLQNNVVPTDYLNPATVRSPVAG